MPLLCNKEKKMRNKYSLNTIGKTIELVIGYGFTMKAAAESVGVSPNLVHEWIKNHYPPYRKKKVITLKSRV